MNTFLSVALAPLPLFFFFLGCLKGNVISSGNQLGVPWCSCAVWGFSISNLGISV